MKLKFIILVFFTIAFWNKDTMAKEPELRIKATFRGIYNLPNGDDTQGNWAQDYNLFEIHLINNSNSSVKFLTYNCAPGTNIVWDNKNLRLITNDCVSNNLTTITLQPKQDFSFPLIFKSEKGHPIGQIKFGWILLNYENTLSPEDYHNVIARCQKSLEYVIWSNSISLDVTPWINYEIR